VINVARGVIYPDIGSTIADPIPRCFVCRALCAVTCQFQWALLRSLKRQAVKAHASHSHSYASAMIPNTFVCHGTEKTNRKKKQRK
jgi:hypothetical protein